MIQKNFIKLTICFLIFLYCSCGNKENKIIVPEEPAYIQLHKFSITGDFDGDDQTDTLYQNIINETSKIPIDSFPDNQWDSIEKYFYKINADVILTLSDKQYDTLHLGCGGGLYCLINIGDNNNDGKDEIAFVVNYYNFTNISPCYIYTLCGNKWTELKSFKIHEMAFEFEGDSIPIFKQINGFLEYREDKWYFIDYNDLFNADSDKDTMLEPLKIKRGC